MMFMQQLTQHLLSRTNFIIRSDRVVIDLGIILISGITLTIAILAINSSNVSSSTIENAFGQSDVKVNIPPLIVVTSPIEGDINRTVILNASISDPDGNVSTIIWNQEDESGPVKMNITQDKQSMSFIPTQNVTYVFNVEAIDNNGSATLESILVTTGHD